MSSSLISGSFRLSRFILRRDRVRLCVWLICLAGFTIGVTLMYPSMFATEAERVIMGETMANPAMTALLGPGYGMDNYTIGAMLSHQLLSLTSIAVAVMNILFVIRHTRRDEEAGRIEVIRSLSVGRLSSLFSAMSVAFAMNIAIWLLTGFSMAALGIESVDLIGSLFYGAVLGATGFCFAGFAALFAQLSGTSRGASALSFATLGIAYLLRAAGDVSSETLSRISPLGLPLRAQVYVSNILWPVLAVVLCGAVLAGIAFWLCARRDMQAGILPVRPGRPHASAWLRSPGGLCWRLTHNSLLVWLVALFSFGVMYGSVFGDMDAFFEGNEFLRQLLSDGGGKSFAEQFLSMLLAVMAMLSTVPVLMTMLKLRTEERRGRTEGLLSRVVSRRQMMAGYVIVSLAACVVLQAASALGLYAAAAVTMADPIPFSDIMGASMAYLPAMWCLTGFTAFLIAFVPDATLVVWAMLGYSIFAVYLGRIFNIPDWLARLSPFGNIPSLPAEPMAWGPLLILTGISAALLAGAFIGYRQRDVAIG